MILRTLVLGLCGSLLVGSLAGAVEVPVRSGEHRTFSRLVFADAPSRSWTISRSESGEVVIEFSEGAPDLDTSAVFDLIPRSRITDVSANRRRLTLALGCDCPVEVFQIPSGHVVIDVRDGGPLANAPRPKRESRPFAKAILPVVFPSAEIFYRQMKTSQPMIVSPMRETGDVALGGPQQVRLHPSGVVPLIRTQSDPQSAPINSRACPVETVAGDALLSDPSATFKTLGTRMEELLDGEDRLDTAAVRRLALTYLAAGFGAEAAQAAALVPSDDGVVAIVAAAIDGGRMQPGVELDPGCGPATATIALLGTAGIENWDRSDKVELRRFLDALDAVTWTFLRPRLQSRLMDLGDDAILVGLGSDTTSSPEQTPVSETLAAGTDDAAVRAAIALLERSNAAGGSALESHLVNAMALLPSIPEGALRQELENVLAAALVLSRRPVEAVQIVADGRVAADSLLKLAFDRLPEFASAEFAVRLEPYLEEGSEAAGRASIIFEDLGLDATARSFGTDGVGALPTEVKAEGPLADPWLARDLQSMSQADPAEWTARNRLAVEIIDRNAAEVPAPDLAAAGAILDRSRTISGLLANLLATDASDVTSR